MRRLAGKVKTSESPGVIAEDGATDTCSLDLLLPIMGVATGGDGGDVSPHRRRQDF